MISDLLQKAKEIDGQSAALEIIETFSPKINASLRQVPYEYREDLKQELYVSMLEVIQRFE
ncbi:helix-turn-helix domain-containing protein [Paenibacillus antibioticophila]|uniref:Helix-turn-helix conjugative transposon-like domain-containing protein n=1 Tax=Paenibacillus antibioticophila TaxID=1274374 RepID=A0A919XQA9_9BACL|nr:helix-turn-helix domain-containing protein [Paenibacillus antibioticophila]GIO35588.1 hypothetical protein J41TS12_04490 [Paenibacillus antibioticophila]